MSDLAVVARELSDVGLEVTLKYPLAVRTTYGVGGVAEVAVSVKTEAQAISVAGVLSAHPDVETLVVGRGSNLLVADSGFHGVAVLMDSDTNSDGITLSGEFLVVTADVLLPVLARRSVALGRCGLEWAVGVPGTVGGAVRMNAGGHGSDIARSLESARVVSLKSGNVKTLNAADLGLHFRGSAMRPWHLVLGATFSTTAPVHANCAAELSEIVSWRREHQPGGRNAGSVFVNPGEGENSSGAIVERCGLSGFRIGSASVSTKHANFIQADADGIASDVIEVMCAVQDKVLDETGIHLRSEVQLVGVDHSILDRFAGPHHFDESVSRARVSLATMMGDSHE
jgi:UDP-N-acetylmuramate dehydrogenase